MAQVRNQNSWMMTIRLLLVLAFVSAGISPACRFIAQGKTGADLSQLIQICTAGGYKTVQIPQIKLDKIGQNIPKNNHKNKELCPFCVFAHNGKLPGTPLLTAPASAAPILALKFPLLKLFMPGKDAYTPYIARAPPLFS